MLKSTERSRNNPKASRRAKLNKSANKFRDATDALRSTFHQKKKKKKQTETGEWKNLCRDDGTSLAARFIYKQAATVFPWLMRRN